jgi:hypothetical protein
MLAGLVLELALRVERASRALEAEVGAFAARELAGGTDVTCHKILLFVASPATRGRFFEFSDQQITSDSGVFKISIESAATDGRFFILAIRDDC